MIAARALLWCLCVIALGSAAAGARAHRAHHGTPLRHKHSEFVKGKICIGTNGRMSVPSNRETHYRNLRDRFTNCTYVDGNLELTWLQNETMDLSFLKYIREVTGYVLISQVSVRKIVLPQLQIIRGRTLFKLNVRDEEFALVVTMSTAFTLELPALRDVLRGSVGIYNNYNLCHVKTINWDEIITGVNATYVYVYNFTTPERVCPRCHPSCEMGCWGEGPENCQKFSKTNCSPQCAQGRCFGPNPRDCCNTFCAGGCTGPKANQCLACRNFYDEGTCSQECPQMQIYNPTTYSWEPNPNGKYAYGATCVRNCPEHLLKDSGACVRSCPPNKTAVNGECIPCNVTCPKTCRAENPIHSGNIESFKDCTIIDGSIEILEMTFTGFQHVNRDYSFGEHYASMEPDALEVFSTVREVTGYLNVQAHHPNFTSLSYFRNLEVIGGRQVVENLFAALYIVKTSLKSLGLKSLKRVNSGAIAIMENRYLCYAEKIAWNKLVKSKDHKQIIQKNGDPRTCEKSNLVCDPQCSEDGCWGPGPDQCLACQNFKFGETCIQNCSVHPGWDEKELIRNLSSAMEGSESLVEADEYLQPKFKAVPGTASTNSASAGIETQTSSLKPCTSSSWANNGTGPDGVVSENNGPKPETWDHELLRYNHQGNQDGADMRHYYNNGVCVSDSSSSRYCSDPMKTRTEVSIEGNFDSMSKIKEAQVGSLKLNLPLDEDDYLMPSPQHNQNASTYMDLIGEGGEPQEVKDLRFSTFGGSKRCIDNPEYLMSDESVPTQTLGIPTEPVPLESICVSDGSGSDSTPRPGPSKYLPQRSVEEESMSDHEYYNDLQRELQPLRRNETTV
ncbi:hypothetical protein O3G_MSEX002709 [Manduca sexta]|uniref:receptor protein-tyrosine kinase n=1 Tax=Manduca sexta TaxID=7130 RepID=A0A921YPN4_MANSE|nr:hypothetical protein O3G_MSEX002709 [Manduca sexta]